MSGGSCVLKQVIPYTTNSFALDTCINEVGNGLLVFKTENLIFLNYKTKKTQQKNYLKYIKNSIYT